MRLFDISQHLLLLGSLDLFCAALPHVLGTATSTRLGHVSSGEQVAGRRLTGKFLHITDIHPDPYYKTYSSTEGEDACHRGRGPAGYYGAETSDCDTPITLVDATFKWIKENLKDEIDFVIWTGDSARHDNDEKIPRSDKQVITQNQLVVSKFQDVWGKQIDEDDPDPTNDFTIPIVPTFGNNDILPHNIFEEGPNKWTKRFLDIWRQFIPEEQRHQFARGGWFSVEVIPKKLAVISLNTLYFFDSNSAVDGCANKHEPGYEHFEWLRIQLQVFRERGMKVMLMGHVPPARVDSKMSWDETCWQKYTLWQKQYRDVIVANFFGHMNIDHFMLQDFKDINKEYKKGYGSPVEGPKARHAADEEFTTMSATDYLMDLRHYFSQLPFVKSSSNATSESVTSSWFDSLKKKGSKKRKKDEKKHDTPFHEIGGEFAERYSLAFVQASVVPNFLPALRVFEYNVTGLENAVAWSPKRAAAVHAISAQVPLLPRESKTSFIGRFAGEITGLTRKDDEDEEDALKKRPQKHKKKFKFKVPQKPSKSSPPGPAYSPQTFTLLGYTEYSANLTHINNDFAGTNEEDPEDLRWRQGKHHGKHKIGKPHPKKFQYKKEYDTLGEHVFKLKDLTVRSYIDLAKRIGNAEKAKVKEDGADDDDIAEHASNSADDVDIVKKGKKKNHGKKKMTKEWHAFIKRAFVGTIDPEEIEQRFSVWKAQDVAARSATENRETGNYEL